MEVIVRGINEDLIETLSENKTNTAKSVIKELRKFNSMLSIDVEMAIICGQKALDFMLRSACELIQIKPGTKPLDRLIGDLTAAGFLPELIEKHCRVIKDFGNIAAHGSASNSDENYFELSVAEAAMCSISLNIVVMWYKTKILPKVLDSFPFEILYGSDLTEKQQLQALQLDEKIYQEEFQGTLDIAAKWFEKNPDIYTFILDKRFDRIIGYLNALPLEEEMIQKIESGQFL